MQKYYLEIKNRLFLLGFCWFTLLATCYFYKETLLFLFVNATNSRHFLDIKSYFIFTNVTELFNVYLNLIFLISNQIFTFVFIYHILMFFSLGLYRPEYNQVKLFLKTFLFYWVVSIILLYYVIIPISWYFFLSFQHESSSETTFFFEAKIIEYFTFFSDLYYTCLLIVYVLVFATTILNSGFITMAKIKSLRKSFYFIFLLFSTLITPPDVISQLFLTSNLIVIYELLIFKKAYNKRSFLIR